MRYNYVRKNKSRSIKIMENKNPLDILESIPNDVFDKTRPYVELIMRYNCAMLEVKTKLDVLNNQLSLVNDRNPFESINCRIKSPKSIIEKLKRKNFPLTVESIEKNLNDVAGVRVICSFPEDIYMLAHRLSSQDDINVIEVKDYIKNPKKNGYRSLHLIIEIPIFLIDEKKYMRVEVQFRTIAMDFWASLEHKVRYKKENSEHDDEIYEELKACAEEISRLDIRMQEIRNKIYKN